MRTPKVLPIIVTPVQWEQLRLVMNAGAPNTPFAGTPIIVSEHIEVKNA